MNTTDFDKVEYRRLLDEIGEDYCPYGHYCIFKEFLIAAHPSKRLLVQLKCMDKFKYIRSKDSGQDVGWDKTMQLWIDEGHAQRFAELYKEDETVPNIFSRMFPAQPGNG